MNRDATFGAAASPAIASAAPSGLGPMAVKVDASAEAAASAEPGAALAPVPTATRAVDQSQPAQIRTRLPARGSSPVALGSVLVLAFGIVLVAGRLVGRRLARAP